MQSRWWRRLGGYGGEEIGGIVRRLRRGVDEDGDVLGAPGFDCLHPAMKTTTAGTRDTVAGSLGNGGHLGARGALRRLSDVDEIEEQRRRKTVMRGGMDGACSRAAPGARRGHGEAWK